MAEGKARRLLAPVAAATMVVGLLAGCATAGGSKPTGGPGASSAQQAVGNLLSALSVGRYDQALLDITPGEDAALSYGLNDLASQLVRLGVVTSNTSLANLPGVKFVFSNPSLSVAPLGNDLDFVRFTGGSVTASATPSQLPVGPRLNSALDPVIAKAHPVSKTSPLGGSPDDGLVASKVNGRWYVSLAFSIAEAVRRSHHLGQPASLLDIQPAGSSSPDAAVRDLMASIGRLDLVHLIALTPPDELPALRDYASLFLPAARSGLARLKSESISVTSPTLHDQNRPDGTLVQLDQLKVVITSKSSTITYANGCLTVDTVATFQLCKGNVEKYLGTLHLPPAAADLVKLVLSLKPDMGIVTVNEGGKWYVSPTRTYLDNADAMLAALTPTQIDEIVNDITALVHSVPHINVGGALG